MMVETFFVFSLEWSLKCFITLFPSQYVADHEDVYE